MKLETIQPPQQAPKRSCHLSMAPRIVPRLLALLKDTDSNPEEIVEVIRLDPSLVARLIATCKSAAIQRGEEIASVDDAVRCLGFLEVYRIVVTVAFRGGFSDRFYAYQETPDELWRRSVLTGYFMEEFADEIGGNRVTNYSIGLLHAIGMFYIDWHCEDRELPKLPRQNRDAQLKREKEISGHTHTELTSMVLEYWGFPDTITSAIRLCDAPEIERAFFPEAVQLALSIRLASSPKDFLDALTNETMDEGLSSPGGKPLGPIIKRVFRHLEQSERFLAI